MKSSKQKIIIFFRNVLFVVFVAEWLAIFSVIISENPKIWNAITQATTVQPENFTELYFENHLKLPKNVEVNKKNVFTFAVHNLENQDTTYPYEVFIDIDGKRINLDLGKFTLKQNQSKRITERYIFNHEIKKTKIVVNLIDKNQQIDFWINEGHETVQ